LIETHHYILQRDPEHAPKVYFYPTGPLAHLPIHAAGEHIRPQGEALLDYLTPSYVTSLQNLTFPPPLSSHDAPLRVLAISQPDTPGQNPLPAADAEIAVIRKHVPPDQLFVAERKKGNKECLLTRPWLFSQHNPLVLHCACHARQDPYDPLSSAFYLYNGELKLSRLLTQRNSKAFLAVLSACETAAGNEMRPDETLHIGAAMNCLQGFQSVIATLWSMHDKDGPALADVLYKELFSTDQARRSDPAAALRLAVNDMRANSIPLIRWVPFVHFGL
jgi:CHAT domain-containing protein